MDHATLTSVAVGGISHAPVRRCWRCQWWRREKRRGRATCRERRRAPGRRCTARRSWHTAASCADRSSWRRRCEKLTDPPRSRSDDVDRLTMNRLSASHWTTPSETVWQRQQRQLIAASWNRRRSGQKIIANIRQTAAHFRQHFAPKFSQIETFSSVSASNHFLFFIKKLVTKKARI